MSPKSTNQCIEITVYKGIVIIVSNLEIMGNMWIIMPISEDKMLWHHRVCHSTALQLLNTKLVLSIKSSISIRALNPWLDAWSAPSHYLNQCWNIVNWTLGNKLQWKPNRNLYIFIQENAFENIVWEMVAVLSRPQCVNRVTLLFASSSIYNVSKDIYAWFVLCCGFGFTSGTLLLTWLKSNPRMEK